LSCRAHGDHYLFNSRFANGGSSGGGGGGGGGGSGALVYHSCKNEFLFFSTCRQEWQ